MMRRVYAFDVDETLDVSGGPIPLSFLKLLKAEGHIVGICGNWYLLVREVADWSQFVSFFGPLHGIAKATFLKELKDFVQEDAHIFVGNEPHDRVAAEASGWAFVPELAFATHFIGQCAK